MPIPSPRRWFILGRESLIAAAEIDAVLGLKTYDYSPPILKVDGQKSIVGASLARDDNYKTFQPHDLINRLGGTIKIAEEIADNVGREEMKERIFSELRKVEGKINFGISIYDAQIMLKEIKDLGLEIKRALKNEGRSVRYVENKESMLSSVAVEKNGLTLRGREFLIEKKGNKYSIAKTEAVQPFEEFSARDFGRPGRDDLSGMLPPKLAMILINLAQIHLDSTLLDPFCGSGTILSEALLLGYNNLVGSDISEKAIADSKKNIEWVAQKFQISNDKFQIKYQISNVENLNTIISANSIDAIITEPYLGKPLRGQETKQELISQAKQLKDLYLQAFQQFYQILKPKGKIVFIVPRFKYAGEWITIDINEEISASGGKKTGFKALPFFEGHLHFVYFRPNQKVAREIWRFVKR